MGAQFLSIIAAQIDTQRAYEQLRQIPEKIRIEEERNNQVSSIILANGKTFGALSYSEAIANGLSLQVGTSTQGEPFASVTWNPSSVVVGDIRESRDLLQATQQSTIGNINSAATVKQLLLDQALIAISLERAANNANQQTVIYREQLAELQRTVRGYVSAQQNLANAYFANPAYRLQRDIVMNQADKSFEAAMEACYTAAKALEYSWSEDFNNPVARLDGGLPETLLSSSDPYVRAESIFAVKFASLAQPNLQGFRNALQQWDTKMRQLRPGSTQSATAAISIRKEVLGFDGGDDALNRLLFNDFIRQNRVAGANLSNDDLVFEFGLEIADQKFFQNEPNVKIIQIELNLLSGLNGSIAKNNTTAEPANVELIMLDQATVRTFFATPPTDDDLLIYDLQGSRSLDESQFFRASIDAKIDNFSSPVAIPNTQLAGHSPAVSRWVLRMQMERRGNSDLVLENLDDIILTFTYRIAKPPIINF